MEGPGLSEEEPMARSWAAGACGGQLTIAEILAGCSSFAADFERVAASVATARAGSQLEVVV